MIKGPKSKKTILATTITSRTVVLSEFNGLATFCDDGRRGRRSLHNRVKRRGKRRSEALMTGAVVKRLPEKTPTVLVKMPDGLSYTVTVKLVKRRSTQRN